MVASQLGPLSKSSGAPLSLGTRLLARLGDGGLPRARGSELLDGPGCTHTELRENFRDMDRVNRALGGHRLTLKALPRVLDRDEIPTLRILDLGTGDATFARAVARYLRREGVSCHITAADARSEFLDLADTRGFPEIALELVDMLKPPYADDSYDVVCCSLVLHHLSREDAVVALRQMARVASRLVIVNDLVRNPVAYVGALILSRVATRNRLTRHDGPLSVRRAYTIPELLEMFGEAGVEVLDCRQLGLYRVVVTGRRRV